MDYTYSGSGTVRIGGCSPFEVVINYPILFSLGSVVYSRPKALKGVLERIAIKDVRVFTHGILNRSQLARYGYFTPLYIDTLNGYHNQEDLCGYTEAVELATRYLDRIAAAMEADVLNCR
jgi:hypothetical protein